MKHWKHFSITEETDVGHVLSAAFTRRQISRLKHIQGIQKNGRPARTSDPVFPGDTVSALLYERPDISVPFPVLYEDEHILAIHKAPGQVCHPSPGHETGTIQQALPGCHLAGRLDKDTSGILLFAKYPALVHQLHPRKSYKAIVHGFAFPLPFTIDIPLKTVTVCRHSRSVPDPQGKPASTIILAQEGPLLTIRIGQGRMHQIRAHLAALGCPLLGDPIYGKGDACRTMLHCSECVFVHPVTKKEVRITDPLPEDFRNLLK